MDDKIYREGDCCLHDVLSDDQSPDPERVADARLQLASIDRRLSKLPERKRGILRARFGLTTGEKETLQSIGERFGLSRQRIRQIEEKALSNMGIKRRKTG